MGSSNGSNGSGHRKPPISADEAAKLLSMRYRVPTIDLSEYEVAPEILALVPRALCERHVVVPVSRAGTSLIVAMTDPTLSAAIDALREHTGFNIEPVIASEDAIRTAIERYYGCATSP
jgi:type IV pilus assembly protein PilB